MIKNKYDSVLNQFELYYPDMYRQAVDWWGSGRASIGVKLKNGTMIDFNSIDNTIRTIRSTYENDDESRRIAFGYNLRKIITFCGMSKSEIAERLGITNTMLSRYIHGKTMPSVDKAYQLANLIGCTIDELFDENYIE